MATYEIGIWQFLIGVQNPTRSVDSFGSPRREIARDATSHLSNGAMRSLRKYFGFRWKCCEISILMQFFGDYCAWAPMK